MVNDIDLKVCSICGKDVLKLINGICLECAENEVNNCPECNKVIYEKNELCDNCREYQENQEIKNCKGDQAK